MRLLKTSHVLSLCPNDRRATPPGYALLSIQLGGRPWRLRETLPRHPGGAWSAEQLGAWAAAKEEAVAALLGSVRRRRGNRRGQGFGLQDSCLCPAAFQLILLHFGRSSMHAPLPSHHQQPQPDAPVWWRAWCGHLWNLPRGAAPDYDALQSILDCHLAQSTDYPPDAPPSGAPAAAAAGRRAPAAGGDGGAAGRKRTWGGAGGGASGGAGGAGPAVKRVAATAAWDEAREE